MGFTQNWTNLFQYLPVFVVDLRVHGMHFICVFIEIEGLEVTHRISEVSILFGGPFFLMQR